VTPAAPIRDRLDYLLGEADLGAPELHDALRAVLDVCDAYCHWSRGEDYGLVDVAGIRRAIAEKLGVES
jgi:hypothetical protein